MARLPETRPSLVRQIRYQQRQVRRLGTSSPFTRSGASVTSENVTEVDGQWQSSAFDGNLDAGNAGTKGWAMNDQRAAIGELFLRPGSIGNDALTSPMTSGVGSVMAVNFVTPTADGVINQSTVTIPDGFTKLSGYCEAKVQAVNSTAATDYIYAHCEVDTNVGNTFVTPPTPAGNFSGTLATGAVVLETGLVGGQVVTFRHKIRTQAAWAANSLNQAELLVFVNVWR